MPPRARTNAGWVHACVCVSCSTTLAHLVFATTLNWDRRLTCERQSTTDSWSFDNFITSREEILQPRGKYHNQCSPNLLPPFPRLGSGSEKKSVVDFYGGPCGSHWTGSKTWRNNTLPYVGKEREGVACKSFRFHCGIRVYTAATK